MKWVFQPNEKKRRALVSCSGIEVPAKQEPAKWPVEDRDISHCQAKSRVECLALKKTHFCHIFERPSEPAGR